MLVNVHNAKSQLSRLIAAAEAGDDVVIARKGKPAVRLVPVKPGGFQFDTLANLVDAVPDFNEPMDEDELALWEGKE
ncbi:MAG: type II toxin-antitoxin system prevent-host-death family antitoxin [Gammaproteobacteria bacterium]|nr:type II toxin-antitoxin system prevent-host-death family antitoxin [Gammaproteobacteria bacterium]